MESFMTYRFIGMLLAASVFAPTVAWAQDDSWQAEEAAGAAPQVAQATAATGTDATYVGGSDHARVVRTFAIGYLGQARLLSADPANPDAGGLVPVDAPILGGRYWFNPRMGLDLGIGISTGSSTVSVNGMADIQVSDPFALALRVGVPFALLDSRHFVFEVVPEATLGITSNTVDAPMADFNTGSSHFDLGARAGAELHFGFIGIPQLALQAGIGLRFSHDGGSVDQSGDEVLTFSANRLATSLEGNPWDIFAGNISALYYFSR